MTSSKMETNPTKCIKDIYDPKSVIVRKCSRDAVQGGYCFQHSSDAIAKRQEGRKERAAQREKKRSETWRNLGIQTDEVIRLRLVLLDYATMLEGLNYPITKTMAKRLRREIGE